MDFPLDNLDADQFDTETADEWLKIDKKKRKAIAKTKHPAHSVAKQSNDPLEQTRKYVDGLKTNRAGSKLTDGPVKKLKEYLQGIPSDNPFKSTADAILSLLDSTDEPGAKIEKIKAHLPSFVDALGDDDLAEIEDVHGGDTQ
jgi:hypothetical protein